MEKIVVIGGGGHAKVLICVLKKSEYDVVGYTDVRDRGLVLGVPHLGEDSVLGRLIESDALRRSAIGVGKVTAGRKRLQLQEEVESLGFVFPLVVSPSAVINEDVRLGAGTVVFDGVVVNPGTEVGRASILNTNCTVEHDCRIGDDVHLGPGATISGGVDIGDGCMIGAGATLIQGVTVCDDCVIGAGAVVVDSIYVRGTYVGNPTRRLR